MSLLYFSLCHEIDHSQIPICFHALFFFSPLDNWPQAMRCFAFELSHWLLWKYTSLHLVPEKSALAARRGHGCAFGKVTVETNGSDSLPTNQPTPSYGT